jgi:hypothetical protein
MKILINTEEDAVVGTFVDKMRALDRRRKQSGNLLSYKILKCSLRNEEGRPNTV